jgi:hypothetical protein
MKKIFLFVATKEIILRAGRSLIFLLQKGVQNFLRGETISKNFETALFSEIE